jgi:hypothetical protein
MLNSLLRSRSDPRLDLHFINDKPPSPASSQYSLPQFNTSDDSRRSPSLFHDDSDSARSLSICSTGSMSSKSLNVWLSFPGVASRCNPVSSSSTCSTFYSCSPTLAVTGPVEIHAFSTWN